MACPSKSSLPVTQGTSSQQSKWKRRCHCLSKAMIGCDRLILLIMKMGSEERAIPSTHKYDRKAAGWNHALGQAEISDVVGTHLAVGREPKASYTTKKYSYDKLESECKSQGWSVIPRPSQGWSVIPQYVCDPTVCRSWCSWAY